MKSNLKPYNEYIENMKIGDKVQKISGKPFKSGLKEGTVKDIQPHSITGRVALILVEDDTEVEAFRCYSITKI